MAKAKISSISKTNLYFGKNSGQDTLSVTLDLSEIAKSSYKYEFFAYLGEDKINREKCFSNIAMKSTNSTSETVEVKTPSIVGICGALFPSDATKSDAYVEVVTYNSSGTEIASHRKKFSAKLHSDVKPVAGDLSFNPANVCGHNILLSNLNAFSVKIGYSDFDTKGAEWKPTPGSKIVSYTISQYISNEVTSVTKKTSSGYCHHKYPSVNIPSGKSLKYVITIKDARGRTYSVERLYTNWKSYYRPIISDLYVSRCDQYGAIQDDGQYILLTEGDIGIQVAPVSVNGKNINAGGSFIFQRDGKSIEQHYATNNGLVFDMGDTKTHAFSVQFTDAVGGAAIPMSFYIPSVQKIINIRPNGNGIAFGAKADKDNEFRCAWNITCSGTITSPNGVCKGSDVRLKTNIKDLDVNILDNLRPVSYELIQAQDSKSHFGFIAQEVAGVLSDEGFNPEMTGLFGYITKEGQQLYTLAYDEFIPLIVKKCQELQQENNEMRAEIAEIKQLLLQASSE